VTMATLPDKSSGFISILPSPLKRNPDYVAYIHGEGIIVFAAGRSVASAGRLTI
jgi:hypothetical protein